MSHSSREQVGEAGFSLGGSLQLPARMLTLPGVKPTVGGELVWTPDLACREGHGWSSWQEEGLRQPWGPDWVCKGKILARL